MTKKIDNMQMTPNRGARAGLKSQENAVKRIGFGLVILSLSSGCVVVGGYSSERGWFLWPGSIVIFLVVAVLFLVLRRRK